VIARNCETQRDEARDGLVGETFGRLVVLRLLGSDRNHQRVWECRCVCNKIHRATTGHLRSGGIRSCGCLRNETLAKYRRPARQLEFVRFGKLLALQPEGKGRSYRWLCECDCGRLLRVQTWSLTAGISRSCGCGRKQGTLKSLHRGMMRRCYDNRATGYAQYGGAGVTVCRRWKTFKNFERDLSPRPATKSLGRLYDRGGYWCGGCSECRHLGRSMNAVWMSPQQQGEHRRMRKRLARFTQAA
jgi:hypothetical protein